MSDESSSWAALFRSLSGTMPPEISAGGRRVLLAIAGGTLCILLAAVSRGAGEGRRSKIPVRGSGLSDSGAWLGGSELLAEGDWGRHLSVQTNRREAAERRTRRWRAEERMRERSAEGGGSARRSSFAQRLKEAATEGCMLG